MSTNRGFAEFLVALIVVGLAADSAKAVSATGSVSAIPSGANYLYTISLKNTSATDNIETFWFSWAPDNYDFLPSVPTPTGEPANWTAYVETGSYGNSIQFYDTGSSPITPGQTNSSFQFLSSDPPTELSSTDDVFSLPMTYSYVYAGKPAGPLDDPDASSSVIFSMPVTAAPEPSGFLPAGIGGAICLLAMRRNRTAGVVQS